MYLVIGGNSEIGGATARHLEGRGRQVLTTTRRPGEVGAARPLLDFDAPLGDWALPEGTEAACIFVAVARLAACENDPAGSARINCERTIALAERLVAQGVFTLFLSTDKVFDGSRPTVPAEMPPSPLSEYGRQKARTEAAIRAMMARGAPAAILRLSKVASPGMALLADWRRELAAGRPIRAFSDMRMAPVPTALVATAIARMLEDRDPVVAQLSGPRDVTYAEVARRIARDVGADAALVEEVSARDHGMPPGGTARHTTLDSAYLGDRYGIAVPDVEDVVRAL